MVRTHPQGKARKIIYGLDPRFRQKSEQILQVDERIKNLLDDMACTLYEQDAIGMAAVHVGVLKNIVVIDHDYIITEYDKSDKKPMEHLLFMVNPKVIKSSDNKRKHMEGNISFPDMQYEIERPAEVEVEYLDYNGTKQQIKASGLLATCIQHEVDHTRGVIFLDYLSALKRKMAMKKLEKYKGIDNARFDIKNSMEYNAIK